MYEIAYWKINAVIGMAKDNNLPPATAVLVKKFDKIKFHLDQDLHMEGMQIIHDMFVEMKTTKSAHKIWEHNGDMMDLLNRAEKSLEKNSALIFLLDPILQCL